MQNNLHIRQASFNDIATIQSIAYRTWPSTYGHIISAEQIDYMLKKMYDHKVLLKQMKNNTQFLIAEHNGMAAGFAGFGFIEGWNYKLQKLYVLPDKQGLKVGNYLLEAVKGRLLQKNIRKISLQVNRHNTAVGFYKKQGFVITEEKDFDFGDGYYMNDYVMELHF